MATPRARPNEIFETELTIEESIGPNEKIVRLHGISVTTTPSVGDKIDLDECRFKVVQVSHRFSDSPPKHLVIVTVEKPQPTVAQ